MSSAQSLMVSEEVFEKKMKLGVLGANNNDVFLEFEFF